MKKKISSEAKRALLIINPVSGTGDSTSRSKLLIDTARTYGWKGEMVETTKKVNAGVLAKRGLTKGVKHIIVCGGDGTIMEVL